jgi:hypothetical protein
MELFIVYICIIIEYIMGTHALVRFQEQRTDGKIDVYVVIYFQYDGYLDGVGMDLYQFITSKPIVNGYTDEFKEFNGYDCMIAQYIAKFKRGAGNMYMCPANVIMDEHYNYTVTYNKSSKDPNMKFLFTVNDSKDMSLDQFKNYCMDHAPSESSCINDPDNVNMQPVIFETNSLSNINVLETDSLSHSSMLETDSLSHSSVQETDSQSSVLESDSDDELDGLDSIGSNKNMNDNDAESNKNKRNLKRSLSSEPTLSKRTSIEHPVTRKRSLSSDPFITYSNNPVTIKFDLDEQPINSSNSKLIDMSDTSVIFSDDKPFDEYNEIEKNLQLALQKISLLNKSN